MECKGHNQRIQENFKLRSKKSQEFIEKTPSRLTLVGTWVMALMTIAILMVFCMMNHSLDRGHVSSDCGVEKSK